MIIGFWGFFGLFLVRFLPTAGSDDCSGVMIRDSRRRWVSSVPPRRSAGTAAPRAGSVRPQSSRIGSSSKEAIETLCRGTFGLPLNSTFWVIRPGHPLCGMPFDAHPRTHAIPAMDHYAAPL